MCGFRPSASTLATWLSAYYFSAAYCREELHQEMSFLTLLLRDDGVKRHLSAKNSYAAMVHATVLFIADGLCDRAI